MQKKEVRNAGCKSGAPPLLCDGRQAAGLPDATVPILLVVRPCFPGDDLVDGQGDDSMGQAHISPTVFLPAPPACPMNLQQRD